MNDLQDYRYRGARALVLLHEQELKRFLDVWRQAKASGIKLPEVEDPDYASLDALLRHVLRAARGYMTWICSVLELADPEIEKTPGADGIDAEADRYVAHLLKQWRKPLTQIPEERFHNPVYAARWKVDYCIDAMLEHAVLHPIRHSFQLAELMG